MATATNISGASPAWHSSLASFFPGYFALVMATGIVSLAAHFLGHEYIAQALLWLNVFAYAVLWAITFIRFVCYRAQNRKPRRRWIFLCSPATRFGDLAVACQKAKKHYRNVLLSIKCSSRQHTFSDI
jgi:hypothetical protein